MRHYQQVVIDDPQISTVETVAIHSTIERLIVVNPGRCRMAKNPLIKGKKANLEKHGWANSGDRGHYCITVVGSAVRCRREYRSNID